MADRETQMIARIAPGVGTLNAMEWNALAGSGDPFLSHGHIPTRHWRGKPRKLQRRRTRLAYESAHRGLNADGGELQPP